MVADAKFYAVEFFCWKLKCFKVFCSEATKIKDITYVQKRLKNLPKSLQCMFLVSNV